MIMLFLLFQLGKDRYALEASRVVEVVPLLELKQFPQNVNGLAGMLNYRGQPLPAIDLCQLTSGTPARNRLSTRIIIVECPDPGHAGHLLGLIAENATSILRKDPNDFSDPGVRLDVAPYLGPILWDSQGAIQWVDERLFLTPEIRNVLFSRSKQLRYEPS